MIGTLVKPFTESEKKKFWDLIGRIKKSMEERDEKKNGEPKDAA